MTVEKRWPLRRAFLTWGALTILAWYGLIVLFKFIAEGVIYASSR